ncbi:TVP38/TMEM64 family protein [Mariprofundus sp. EBB-1]|uniref:TVP38/TMEM64 family protein n=1 Tax=Mariprofundus sp. EBB-1 TaxID=2650971 RepID=UPI000EF18CAB|nr:TVP38/TMEM64 family protein [Mariprofundus sp. EBB-1]RLL52239.1 TVP38/TMEM64 family protein [Mariprofundus sp. EBB-1]
MFKRIMPLMLLAGMLVLFFGLDLAQYISFDALAEHRVSLLSWVDQHAMLAPLAYILLYVVVVAFSLPGGLVMTVSGGFLFGAIAGGMYAVIGASLGATALFLIAKTSVGDYLLSKAGDMVHKMQKGFAEDALSYMFVLRLVPLFPFFIVNLVPAFLGVSLRTYVVATFFGIMPATFVYALAGSGFGSVLDQGQGVTLTGVLTPEMLAALLGLALLAMIPVIYKRMSNSTKV